MSYFLLPNVNYNIESVNITYNPNNTSLFKNGNNPVEVAMSVTLKEIVPIYRHDIEGGM